MQKVNCIHVADDSNQIRNKFVYDYEKFLIENNLICEFFYNKHKRLVSAEIIKNIIKNNNIIFHSTPNYLIQLLPI